MSEKITVFPDRKQEIERLARKYWESPEKDGYATVEEEIEDSYTMYTAAIGKKSQGKNGLTVEDEQLLWESFSDYVFRDKPQKFISMIEDQLQI